MPHTVPAHAIVGEHMRSFLRPDVLKTKLRLARRVLRDYDFDTLAFRGMSGAFVGPSLAMALDKQMILVRKPEDSTHSFRVGKKAWVEGYKEVRRYIIVDDFTATGDTKNAIIDAVRIFSPGAECLGLLGVKLLYEDVLEEYQVKSKSKPYPLS